MLQCLHLTLINIWGSSLWDQKDMLCRDLPYNKLCYKHPKMCVSGAELAGTLYLRKPFHGGISRCYVYSATGIWQLAHLYGQDTSFPLA